MKKYNLVVISNVYKVKWVVIATTVLSGFAVGVTRDVAVVIVVIGVKIKGETVVEREVRIEQKGIETSTKNQRDRVEIMTEGRVHIESIMEEGLVEVKVKYS